MSKRRAHPGTLKFVILAIILMVLVDMFLFRTDSNHMESPKDEGVISQYSGDTYVTPLQDVKEREGTLEYHYPSGRLSDILYDYTEEGNVPVDPIEEQIRSDDGDADNNNIISNEGEEYSDRCKEQTELQDDNAPAWLAHSVDVTVPEGWRTVSVVIDDLGENRKYSREAIALRAPMTMALLPYSSGVDVLAQEAAAKGHEVIIHMPMEPINSELDIGRIALKQSQSEEEFDDMLDRAFAAMEGYAGINNHMGSRLTQDEAAMAHLMRRLKQEGLLFLDSKTIPQSIAAKTAKDYGVPYAYRDVFLDHDPSEVGVRNSIAVLERHIDKHGHAIAIGHPKEFTLKVLREWIDTLDDKMIALVPISYSVKRQNISDLKAPDTTLDTP